MQETRKKIYFAADAHLGARFHQDPLAIEKKLVRWLDSIKSEASAVWFLGDIFDYWYEYKYVVPKGHVRFLGKLAELADAGIEIHIFIGNHDIWMFDYLPNEIGAVIHREPLSLDLLGKRFFLGHGDEVDYRSRSFRFIRALFRNRFCQWLYAAIHPRWTFGFALGWSLNSRKSGLQKATSPAYAGEESEYLIRFAKEYLQTHPEINFFLFGHRHIMLDLMLSRTSRILVVGDWMRLFSYVEWDGENLSLLQFEEE
ncbi:UDP-2,3-diacylglucosamine diphosphatase [Parabacteroides sp. 52]|uniref:UDP-2,3-diacylglucosamine diphosphatase n=1 Tax=unclassified Parabacteroides TaxID=2649774 RepID=UPI0013D076EC|nr:MULTISPECIES: UDP-2,3-diacylglucosamine diphosphatase [unclassified Parabacteroides]MDH6535187.1 UDP-2,3-diacylglucosamine hydrolase [Parabacteroides sp. PM5-20]NDV56226.1 UDP-2,3-diacylglucosamine diphosphatase [Parabacteroides sp. 52]